MTKAFKVLYRDLGGRLWSYMATGDMQREFFRNRETMGWSGTPCLVFDTLAHGRLFAEEYPNERCEIWEGDAREVVTLPRGHLGPPNVVSDCGAYQRYWNKPVDNIASVCLKKWPAGTLAVKGFTPRKRVWHARKRKDNQ